MRLDIQLSLVKTMGLNMAGMSLFLECESKLNSKGQTLEHTFFTTQTNQVKKSQLKLALLKTLSEYEDKLTACEYDYYKSSIEELTE